MVVGITSGLISHCFLQLVMGQNSGWREREVRFFSYRDNETFDTG